MLCALAVCVLQSDKHAIETVLPNGLVVGHAYSITAVKEVSVCAHSLIRCSLSQHESAAAERNAAHVVLLVALPRPVVHRRGRAEF